VKYRGKTTPVLDFAVVLAFNASIFALKSTDNWPIGILSRFLKEGGDSVMLPQYLV
jgi:hypothetical protein